MRPQPQSVQAATGVPGCAFLRPCQDALFAAIELVKPNALYRDLGGAITKTVNSRQCSVVRSACPLGRLPDWPPGRLAA